MLNPDFQIYFYMPSLNSTDSKYPTMIPAGHYEHQSISYIDLDLPPSREVGGVGGGAAGGADPNDNGVSAALAGVRINGNREASTAYKRIDFVKTEAFNRTRNNRRDKYNKELASEGADAAAS